MTTVPEVKIKKQKKISQAIVEPGTLTLNGPVKTPGTALFPVPHDNSFDGDEYVEAPLLEQLARKLIVEHKHLTGLMATLAFDVRFYWKRKGGAHQGKCLRPTGLLRELSDSTFIVWLAADHCQGWTNRQVEALLYHELCHAGIDEQGRTSIIKHDVQAFSSEVAYYGLHTPALRNFGKAVRQLSLDDAL